jgi:putative ATPase
MLEAFRQYNFWDAVPFELGFARTTYLEALAGYRKSNLIMVLTGQRRVGKSYILRQMAAKLIADGVSPTNTLYINMEYVAYAALRTYEDLEACYQEYMQTLKPEGRIYLFIDEVQLVAGWEKFVNSHSQDFVQRCWVFIAGSNSSMLSGELATLLAGRYIKSEVLPYSYPEYCAVTDQPICQQSYIQYLHTGTLPELFNLPKEADKRDYVVALRDTAILRDIAVRYQVKDLALLNDLFTYITTNTGHLVSIANIVNYLISLKRKTNYGTTANYIEYLAKAYLIHKAPRYSIRGKKVLKGVYKYYANDLAFVNYLFPGMAPGMGFLLENAIYPSLHRAGYRVYVGILSSLEVDFVATQGEKRLYVQVALELQNDSTVEREFRPLELIEDSFPKYVVTMHPPALSSHLGIPCVAAWEFDNLLAHR